jgi:hypothetical protein
MCRIAIIILALAAEQGGLALGSDRLGVKDLFGVNRWVVEGRVDDLQTDGKRQIALAKILRVYAGPNALLGRNLHATFDPLDGMFSLRSPMLAGETGVWFVSELPNGTIISREAYRDGVDDRAGPVRAFGLAIERVSRADAEEQRVLLRSYMKSNVAEVSGWAVQALSSVDYESVAALGREVQLQDSLTTDARVSLDRALTAHGTKAWRTSRERVRLLTRWTDKLDSYSVTRMLYYIKELTQAGDLPTADIVELSCRVLLSPVKFSATDRAIGSGILNNCGRSPENKEVVFEGLARIVADASDEAMQLDALRDIDRIRVMDHVEWNDRLVKLRRRVASEKVRAAIDAVVSPEKNKGT